MMKPSFQQMYILRTLIIVGTLEFKADEVEKCTVVFFEKALFNKKSLIDSPSYLNLVT